MKNEKCNIKPLVSIIVPAYNIEQYIQCCIESILKQTISQFEVIAVDDGSTDKTGEILERLSKEDPRITVVHQSNTGVSAARNHGIDIAKGKYIVFVDGDDYVADDYLQYMISLIEKGGSDFALSMNCFTKHNERQIKQDIIESKDCTEATALLLSPRVTVGCWNKIYRRDFIDEHFIRFRTDLQYGGGLNFITTVSQCSNHVTVGRRRVYYYRKGNRYSATSTFNIEKMRNGEKAIDYIQDSLILHDSKIDSMMLLHRIMYCAGAVARIRAFNCHKIHNDVYSRWLKFIRANYLNVLTDRNVTVYRKCLIAGCCISPWIMGKLDMIRRKNIANNSVGGCEVCS